MYVTLQNGLIKIDDKTVRIEVDNSVQADNLKLIKPEMLGFLHRNLQNELIDIDIKLVEKVDDRKILTEDQKLKMMMEKNPSFAKFKEDLGLYIL